MSSGGDIVHWNQHSTFLAAEQNYPNSSVFLLGLWSAGYVDTGVSQDVSGLHRTEGEGHSASLARSN